MLPELTPQNPSQTVERIREIIVGRRLDQLEHRVVRLENPPHQPESWAGFADLPTAGEPPIGLFRDHSHQRVAVERDDSERRVLAHREEIQRLAARIQQTAAAQLEAATHAAAQVEHRLGARLGHWHLALQQHLADRDSILVAQARKELVQLRSGLESRLAAAFRALADSIAPPPPPAPPQS